MLWDVEPDSGVVRIVAVLPIAKFCISTLNLKVVSGPKSAVSVLESVQLPGETVDANEA